MCNLTRFAVSTEMKLSFSNGKCFQRELKRFEDWRFFGSIQPNHGRTDDFVNFQLKPFFWCRAYSVGLTALFKSNKRCYRSLIQDRGVGNCSESDVNWIVQVIRSCVRRVCSDSTSEESIACGHDWPNTQGEFDCLRDLRLSKRSEDLQFWLQRVCLWGKISDGVWVFSPRSKALEQK